MRILPSSNIRSARANRRVASRRLLLESLSSRVVLSSGGWSELAPHSDGLELLPAEAAYERHESSEVREAFGGVVTGKMPAETWNTPNEIVRRDAYSSSPVEPPSSTLDSLSRGMLPAYSVAQSLMGTPAFVGSPALVGMPGLYGVNFVLGPSVTWVIVFDAPGISPQWGVHDSAPPVQKWDSRPGYDGYGSTGGSADRIATPQIALSATHTAEAPTPSADTNATGGGSLANATLASFAHSAADSGMHAPGVFPSAPTTSAATAPPESLPKSEFTLSPNRSETSEADRDGGLIELETPAERRRKLALKGTDAPADEELSAERLRRLLDQVWAGWDQAWSAWQEMRRASGNQTQTNHAQLPAALPPDASDRNSASNADAEIAAAEGGLIELTSEGPVEAAAGPKYMAELRADEGERIRIDAGMALHQSFEVATAAEAAPKSEKSAQAEGTEATSDSSAKAKNAPDETKCPSAALIGAGLLLSLPFSVFHLQQQDGNADRDRKRPHLKFDRLD